MNEGYLYRIRRRAYELWEMAGRPEGKERHFWKLAEEDFKSNLSAGNLDADSGRKATPTGSFPPDQS